MRQKILMTRNPIILTGWLKQNLDSINPNTEYHFVGLNNNNSNVNIINSKFQNNIPIVTHDSGKTVLNENDILIKNKIQDLTFNDGIIYSPFTTNYKIMGEYNINTHFPTIAIKITGDLNRYVSSMYLNDGSKTFWSPLDKGMLLSDVNQNNITIIPTRLNGFTVTLKNNLSDQNITHTNKINGKLLLENEIHKNDYNFNWCSDVEIKNISTYSSFSFYYVDNILVSNFGTSTKANNISVRNSKIKIINWNVDQDKDLTIRNSNVYIENGLSGFPFIHPEYSDMYNTEVYINNNTFANNMTNYFKNGDFTQISSYVNLSGSQGNNVLANHYHHQFEYQHEHYFPNMAMSYISNAPIGTIVWWPESWVSNSMNYNSKKYVYNSLLRSNNWKICSGVPVDNSCLYHKMFGLTKTPDLSRSHNYGNGVKIINSVDHYANQDPVMFIPPDTLRIKIYSVHTPQTSRFRKSGNRTYGYSANQYGFTISVNISGEGGGECGQAHGVVTCWFGFEIDTSKIKEENKEKFLSALKGLQLIYMVNNGEDTELTYNNYPNTKVTGVVQARGQIAATSVVFKYFKLGGLTIPLDPELTRGIGYYQHQNQPYTLDGKNLYPNITLSKNYAVFRRLIPYIKINDDKFDIPTFDPITPYNFNFTFINAWKIRRTPLSDSIITALNLSSNLPKNGYLHHCYAPYNNNGIDKNAFKNNIVNPYDIICYGDISGLYTETISTLQRASNIIYDGTNDISITTFIPKSDADVSQDFMYIGFKTSAALISDYYIKDLISYNYGDIGNDDLQLGFSNYNLISTGTTYKIQFNSTLSKVLINRELMKIVIDTLDREPIQPSNGWPKQSSIGKTYHLWYGYNIPYFNTDDTLIEGGYGYYSESLFLGNQNYRLINIKNTPNNTMLNIKTKFPADLYSNNSISGVPANYASLTAQINSTDQETASNFALKLATQIYNNLNTLNNGQSWISCTLSKQSDAAPYSNLVANGFYSILGSIKMDKTSCIKYPNAFNPSFFTSGYYYDFIAPFNNFTIESNVSIDSTIKTNFNNRINNLLKKLAYGIKQVNNLTPVQLNKYLSGYQENENDESHQLGIVQYNDGLLSGDMTININDDFTYF